MRSLSVTAVGVLLFSSSIFATPKKNNTPLNTIHKRYAEIQVKHYIVQQVNNIVTAYFQNNRIKLIVSETFGEVGKIRHEYYFGKNGELILALNQLFQYDRKFTVDTDKNLVKVSENSYYYQKTKLVKCVNNRAKVAQIDAVSRSRYLLGKSLILTKQIKEQQNDKIIGQYKQNSDPAKLTGGQPAECSAGCD